MAKQEEQAGKEREGKNRTSRIGTENERSLHAAVKKWYAQPGDELEVYVDGYIVDLVRAHARGGQELIEIQTKNLSAIAQKLGALAKNHRVRLVYPLPVEKWIIRTTATGEYIGRRKSPKKGKPIHLFTELIRAPDLLGRKNLVLEILLTREEEIWCEDGKGSWRRKGASRKDRRLLEVIDRIELKNNKDLLGFLPEGLATPFSNKDLAFLLGEPVNLVRMLTYSLRKCGVIEVVGKKGNELLFAVCSGRKKQRTSGDD
ncbi:MAG: hypothetical protein GX894_01785 [Clostridia bacterium]|nr:hypothetical protein [Clostridia bacterium]